MAKVFVARKTCGHIVAAFPVHMDMNSKAEILKQFTRAGYDLEQTSEMDVQVMFSITCDCGKPPLLKIADDTGRRDRTARSRRRSADPGGNQQRWGVGEEDVNALANEDEAGEVYAEETFQETE